MIVKSKALRVLGVVAAALLCLPLVIMLVVTPLYTSVAGLITPQTMTSILRDIDYTEMMQNSVGNAADGNGLPADMMQDVMQTPMMEELITAYTEELTSVLGGEEGGHFTADTIPALIDKHAEELIAIVRTYAPQDADAISDEELRTALKEAASEYGEDLVAQLPTAEDVAEMAPVEGGINPLTMIVDKTIPVALIIATLVLAALTAVCLLHRFRALLWLGIELVVAVLPLAGVLSIVSAMGPELAQSLPPTVVRSMLQALSGNLLTAIFVMVAVGVLLIAGFIAWRVWDKRRAVPTQE